MLHLLTVFLAAAPEPAGIVWAWPTGCPDGGWVSAELSRQGIPEEVALRMRVTLQPLGGGWRVTVATPDGRAVRRLQIAGTDCQEAARAALFVVGLWGRADPTPAPGAAAAVEPQWMDPELELEGKRGEAPSPPRKPLPQELSAQALLSAGAGILPSGSLALGVNVGARWNHVRLELFALHWLKGYRNTQMELSLPVSGGVGACGVWRTGRLEWGPCLRLEAGVLFARGLQVLEARTAHAPWAGIFAGANGRWGVARHLGIRLDLSAGIALVRPRFGLEPGALLYQSAPVPLRASLGFEVTGE